MKMDMDLGFLISHQISHMAQSNSSRLGFPALISALCVARGVVSDSLTFESLSPAINLAYIKKNRWNLYDPMIEFPGTRKARARGSEGPSSAAPASFAPAPPPLPPAHSPAPVPSTPSSSFQHRCSKVTIPLLQSIHRGLCLVMQSMHDSAQHQPFIRMDEFMAQVAWPGVQPSPLRGEVAHEATPEATPQVSHATSPVVEVSEGEEGVEDTDYAAAQSTWDPWPIAAQEKPQPTQDTPFSPHGEPASA
ncbi:hypothetical protein GmHk_18G052293 [Glycine max]|nr:hypothetical protein GmHk_18G052293 [Glycine max]